MSLRESVRSPLARAGRALVTGFFARFFTLLIVLISICQWAIAAWLLTLAGHPVPLPLHIVAPLVVYAMNRSIVSSLRRQRNALGWRRLLVRGYTAVAFTSLFCAVFLLASGALWGVLRILLGAWTAEAGTLQPSAAGSTIDDLFRWVSLAGVGTITVAFAYGYTVGQRRLTVSSICLPLRYPKALHGLRIAQISDIHIGHNLTSERLQQFIQRVNELEPDLICVTGDIADGPDSDLTAQLPLLNQLRAPHGVFAILGNHDHYAGADRVEAALREHTDFIVLRDAIAVIEIGGTRLQIVGIDDLGRDWCRGLHSHPGLSSLESELSPDEPVLLLSHRPEPFTHAAGLGIGLTLSGHTHGGQLAIPWFNGRPRGLAWFVTPFERGLYERDGCYLYVNRGLGVTGPLIRLCTPREISLIEVDATALS